ncbi:Acyl carrier protein [subsurface metagenome]
MSALDELRKSIARVTRCSEQEIKPETALKDIKANSLHWVQIIVSVENALDIEVDIDRERMKELATIEDFTKYIETFIK